MNLLLILITVILNASAQLVLKKGAETLVNNTIEYIFNIYIIFGIFIYALSVLTWIYVLSKTDVSYAYPFLSLGYIITTIGGFYYFNEDINIGKITGILIVSIGVVIISKYS